MQRRLLGRIPLRIILRNKGQFFGIMMLTFLAALAYVVFGLLIIEVNANYDSFKKRTNQEDFHFITAKPINVADVSSTYNIEIEERKSWEFSYDNKTIRFFNASHRINKPDIPEGKLPNAGEIALDFNFMQAQGLKIGDSLKIAGKEFKISGIVYLPDYIYAIKNDTDILPDPSHFGFGILSEKDFKQLVPPVQFHYYMAKGKLNNIARFKEDINKNYTMLSFQTREDNLRIITTELKMKNAEPMSYVLSGIILVISSILLFIVLRRLIGSMHAEIGTLYALGYGKAEIFSTYLRFPIIVWLFGSLPGAIAGYFLADPYVKFYASYFSIPMTLKVFSFRDLGIGTLMPAIFMLIAGAIALRDLLRRSVVEIIRGESEKEFGRTFRMAFLDRFPFKTRLTLKQGLLHPSRELVLILGVLFSTFLLFYAVAAMAGFSGLIEKTYKDTFRYNYMYILQGYQFNNGLAGGEPFNTMTFTLSGEKTKITLFGLNQNSEMIVLKDFQRNRIEPDGLVIAKSLADKLGLSVGDKLNLVSVTTGKKFSFKVQKIADLYVGNNGYMNLKSFNKILGLPENAYLGLLSKDELSIPEETILMKISKQDLIKAFEDNSETINQMFRVMAFISFLLSLTIIYVLSTLTIAENRKPLALFKILGYYDRELSSIFLGFNNISFLIGFLLGIPVFNYFVQVMLNVMLKDYDFAINMQVGISQALTVLVVLGLAFLLSKFLGRRRILKISPSIILKEQME